MLWRWENAFWDDIVDRNITLVYRTSGRQKIDNLIGYVII